MYIYTYCRSYGNRSCLKTKPMFYKSLSLAHFLPLMSSPEFYNVCNCTPWCSCQRSSCHLSLNNPLFDHVDVEAVEVSENASNSTLSAGSNSSCCLVHVSFGKNIFSLLFFSNTLQHFFLKIFSLCHGTCKDIRVNTFQCDSVFISRCLVVRHSVRSVNCVGVIQTFEMSCVPSCCYF